MQGYAVPKPAAPTSPRSEHGAPWPSQKCGGLFTLYASGGVCYETEAGRWCPAWQWRTSMDIQQSAGYHQGFWDARDLEPLFDDASPEYKAGWLAFWEVKEGLAKIQQERETA